ncbi:MAG: tetratricopeptide repeat protein [Candidatus Symbiothrix sp.]|jgi:tetratricopeptide (TPR) repeat protein|nr:tetratricopeptide repeat protein [Candidatus Symbiothrix sp.]
MEKQELQGNFLSIREALENKRLKKAFDLLAFLLSNIQNWRLSEQLTDLSDNYQRMLRYLADGVKDPQQEKVYNDLLRSVYAVADQTMLQLKTIHSPACFYDNRRTREMQLPESSGCLVEIMDDTVSKITLVDLLEEGAEKDNKLRNLEQEKEKTEAKIFRKIWLSDAWNSSEKEIWLNVLNSRLHPNTLLSLIISAATLSLEETFDEKKAVLLLDAATNKNEEIRQRALTGILLFIRRYDKRLFLYPNIHNRLALLTEDRQFINDIRNIILQFILSRETEKITRIIQEEILPEMLKVSPKIGSKIKLDDLMSDSGFEDKNPDWQQLIEDAGLTDRLQEFSELQMEGADVMHSSFLHLKNYAFFNEISNWFVPFTIRSENIGKAEVGAFVKILMESSMLCNSDKFSFYYSISHMPEMYRNMIGSQFSTESEAVREMIKEELPDNKNKIHPVARQYIQDLYRFYKLYPKRAGFEDIFSMKPDFHLIPAIAQFMSDPENRMIIGEYYLNRNYFKEAAGIFDDLLLVQPNDAVLLEKKGYCLQMQGKLGEALEYYRKAELFNANNSWTIKKIAHCYRVLKQPQDALEYYRKAEQLNPDNLSNQLNIGHCHLELKDYSEALKCYFKVEYLSKNKEKAWRPIAWCSFLTGKYKEAKDYYGKILENSPNTIDYLNAGHTELALGNNRNALNLYKSAMDEQGDSIEKFTESFSADIPDLLNAGVKAEDIPIILDSLLYKL